MKPNWNMVAQAGLAAALCLAVGLAQAQEPARQGGPGRGAGRGGLRIGGDPVDARVQLRSYLFKETSETLPYAVYVPTKYSKDKKTPLVLALHGMSGTHATFMRTACVDEAEKNGYILVGPMGYSPMGSFGMPFGMGGRGRRGGAPAGRVGAPGGRRGGRGMGMGMPTVGGTKETDSAKVAELSEKDAMNVLEMVCKEYSVDENRIYLMGHSLGGGGALHMGEKFASKWAAVAAIAPAAFGFHWTADSKLKDVPLLIIQGDADTVVRPEMSQQTADTLKGLKFPCEYKMMPGLDHGAIIAGSMTDVYTFFAAHTRVEAKK